MPVRKQPPAPQINAPQNKQMLAGALAIGMAGLLFLTVPTIDRRLKSTFNERLARHAETLPAGAARLETRRLAGRGVDAIAPLVRLAGSTNEPAADAARVAVQSQLAGWESEFRMHADATMLASRLELLSTALDRWVLSYDPTARAWADRLTLNIVRDCDALPVTNAAELLARCDRILAAPPAVAAPALLVAAETPQTPEPAVEPAPPTHIAMAPESRALPEPLDAELDPGAAPLAVAPSPTGEVRLLEEQPALVAPEVEVAPVPMVSDAPRPLPARDPSVDVVDVRLPQEARRLLRHYRQLSNIDLSQQLAAASEFDARAIQQVLRERKLPTVAGPIAPRALQASDSVERQILEQVSKLTPARGRQLLRSLATDATEDAEVRLQALALLATSGDPMLPQIARQRAMEDADPRVAELATRIMREGVRE